MHSLQSGVVARVGWHDCIKADKQLLDVAQPTREQNKRFVACMKGMPHGCTYFDLTYLSLLSVGSRKCLDFCQRPGLAKRLGLL